MLVCLFLMNKYRFASVFGPHLDLETISLFKSTFSSFGLLSSFSYLSDYSSSYFSPVRVKDIETYSSFLSVNSYLRNEIPLLNSRVRKSNNYYMSSFKFFVAGVGANYFTYPVRVISNNMCSLNRVLMGKSYISKLLISLRTKMVVFCSQEFIGSFNLIFNSVFNPLVIKINSSITELNACHLGLNNFNNLTSLPIYSVGFDTNIDYKPMIYQGHHGNSSTSEALIVMPTAVFSEKSSTYLNLEGLLQKSHAAVSHDKLVKKDWEIFKALKEFGYLVLPLIYSSLLGKFYSLKYNGTDSYMTLLPY